MTKADLSRSFVSESVLEQVFHHLAHPDPETRSQSRRRQTTTSRRSILICVEMRTSFLSWWLFGGKWTNVFHTPKSGG